MLFWVTDVKNKFHQKYLNFCSYGFGTHEGETLLTEFSFLDELTLSIIKIYAKKTTTTKNPIKSIYTHKDFLRIDSHSVYISLLSCLLCICPWRRGLFNIDWDKLK